MLNDLFTEAIVKLLRKIPSCLKDATNKNTFFYFPGFYSCL